MTGQKLATKNCSYWLGGVPVQANEWFAIRTWSQMGDKDTVGNFKSRATQDCSEGKRDFAGNMIRNFASKLKL